MERKKIRAPLGIQVRSVDTAKRVIRFIASDESVDRYGTTISVKGWNLQMYRKNPIFLFGHDYRSPWSVMGRAVRVEKDTVEGELIMDMLFMEKDLNPIAEMVYQMYAHKPPFLNAVSVGFIPLKMEEVKEVEQDKLKQSGPKRKAVLRFQEQELLELSAVTVPANANAVGKSVGHWSKAAEWLRSLKDEPGIDPVQLMAAQTVLADDMERASLQERSECWMEQNGLMVPCACNVREMIEVSTVVRDLGDEQFDLSESSFRSLLVESNELLRVTQQTGQVSAPPTVTRAGAVLNSKNKSALRDALSLIQGVLDSAEPEPSEEAPAAGEEGIQIDEGVLEETEVKSRLDTVEAELKSVRGICEDVYELLRRDQDPDEGGFQDLTDTLLAEMDDEASGQESVRNLDAVLTQVSEMRMPEPENEAVTRLNKAMGLAGAKLAHLKLKV